MKKIILILTLLIISSTVYSQSISEDQVPNEIKENFYSNYKAENVKWELEGGVYEAQYLQEGKEVSVHYKSTGDVVAVETHIDPLSLPETITEYVANNYPGAAITEAEHIWTSHGNFYGLELKSETKSSELLFSESGKFIGSEDNDDSEEDDSQY